MYERMDDSIEVEKGYLKLSIEVDVGQEMQGQSDSKGLMYLLKFKPSRWEVDCRKRARRGASHMIDYHRAMIMGYCKVTVFKQ